MWWSWPSWSYIRGVLRLSYSCVSKFLNDIIVRYSLLTYLLLLTIVVFPSNGHTNAHVMGSTCRHVLQPRTVYPHTCIHTYGIRHIRILATPHRFNTDRRKPRIRELRASTPPPPQPYIILCTTSKKQNSTQPNPSTPLSGPIRIGCSRGFSSTNNNSYIPDRSPTSCEGGLHRRPDPLPWARGAPNCIRQLKIRSRVGPRSGCRLCFLFFFCRVDLRAGRGLRHPERLGTGLRLACN
jgi:hypothetical protein